MVGPGVQMEGQEFNSRGRGGGGGQQCGQQKSELCRNGEQTFKNYVESIAEVF